MNKDTPSDRIIIEGLRARCIIGIFDWERVTEQDISVDLDFPCDTRRASATDRIEDTVDYKAISKAVQAFVEGSRFGLLETLAEKLAAFCMSQFNLADIGVHIRKPGALRNAENVGVRIRRVQTAQEEKKAHDVYLSLGSNIQPEVHIRNVIGVLAERLEIVKMSEVYETKPYGMNDQGSFWNMAVHARTGLSVEALKEFLDGAEEKSGRARDHERYGARTLDIDIIIFDNVWQEESEAEKAPALSDQGFILVPLAEIAPRFKDPVSGKSLLELLAERAYEKDSVKRLGAWPVTNAAASSSK